MKRTVAVVVAVTALWVAVPSSAAVTSLQKRLVVPVAGSLTAFDGSQFRTSLRLTVLRGTGPAVTGRIIFHPQGQPISDSDPSLTYSLPMTQQSAHTVYFEDVVAAMGLSGLGTIDIVPDDDVAPIVEARIVNVREGRVYGDRVPVLNGADVFKPSSFGLSGVFRLPVFDRTTSRINVGIRSFGSSPIRLDITILGVQGTFRHTLRAIPANTFVQLPLDELAGSPVLEGEQLDIVAQVPDRDESSGVFIYYTVTESSTNDPTVVAPLPQNIRFEP